MVQTTWAFGLILQQVMISLKKLSPNLSKIWNSNMTVYNDYNFYRMCVCNDALVEKHIRLGHGLLKAKLYACSQRSGTKSLPKEVGYKFYLTMSDLTN